MCVRKYFLILFVVQIILKYSHGQINKKFFRKDYKYIEDTQSFYKVHSLYKPWQHARRTCALEGASLFYPNDRAECEIVLKYWKEKRQSASMYIGISDLLAKGVYETVDGVSVVDVYTNWEPNEPNDAFSNEDCIVMEPQDGRMNDIDCSARNPFVCRKTLASLSWNVECSMPNKDYVFNGYFGKCYKFGLIPKNWTEAYTVCSAEQSYLAIINSKEEADYFVTLIEKTPKHIKNNDPLAVFLGFHNRHFDGWTTIKGMSLEDSGYSEWHQGHPDGGDEQLCGTVLSNGLLDDVNCNDKHFFICEHDIPATFDNRHGS